MLQFDGIVDNNYCCSIICFSWGGHLVMTSLLQGEWHDFCLHSRWEHQVLLCIGSCNKFLNCAENLDAFVESDGLTIFVVRPDKVKTSGMAVDSESSEIQIIRMDIQDQFRWIKQDDCIRVFGNLIKKIKSVLFGSFCWDGLFGYNFIEGMKNDEINCTALNDMLGEFSTLLERDKLVTREYIFWKSHPKVHGSGSWDSYESLQACCTCT